MWKTADRGARYSWINAYVGLVTSSSTPYPWQIARARVVFPTPSSPVSVTTSGAAADLPSCSPQSRSSFSVSLMWPLSARGGTRWRCAGILAAVQARQRRSPLLLPAGLRLYLEQLIAELRRRLEIQIGRGLAHLRLEIGDQ